MTADREPPRTLALRQVAGELDAVGQAELASALVKDPELRRFHADLLLQVVQLAELAEERRLGVSVSKRHLRRRRRTVDRTWRLVPWLVAGLAAAGMTLVLLPRSVQTTPAAVDRLAASDGLTLRISGSIRPFSIGAELPPGSDLTTSPNGAASIACADGSRITLHASGRLWLDHPGRLRLEAGEVNAEVVHQNPGEELRIATGQAEVAVVGTRFTVGASVAGTVLAVDTGLVRFTPHDAAPLSIAAGGVAACGHGLLGTYFRDGACSDLAFRRVDGGIGFWWDQDSPDPRIPPGVFSVRWTGSLLPDRDGEFTIYAAADDSAQVWLDDRLVIDHQRGWEKPADTASTSAIMQFRTGVPVAVRYEYHQNFGTAFANLSWSGPALPRQIIPADRLRP